MSKFWEDLAKYVVEHLEKQKKIEENNSLINKLKSFINKDKNNER
tara:strand:+ start:62 stop:196 length:135 start_codon:yes stop_codon:yes gene_type:complete